MKFPNMDSQKNGLKRMQYLLKLSKNQFSNFDAMLGQSDSKRVQNVVTATSREQEKVEDRVRKIYDTILDSGDNHLAKLNRQDHIQLCRESLSTPLPSPFQGLDASHPWMIFWLTNSLRLVGGDVKEFGQSISSNINSYIAEGNMGFAGGVSQLGHAAASYASICALALCEDKTLWSKIDRSAIYKWLMDLKQKDGSFVMHYGGECDARAVYCVLCIASLLNIITPELVENTASWILRCQTFEGGFAGTPGDEAHGGYTFCSVAALYILGEETIRKCNLESLTRWTSMRQYAVEGGLSGRTNKLVDGCYSHWVGGLVPILESVIGATPISRVELQNFILNCCQMSDGGFVDKPGKHVDFYHTNYVLCGLSMCQHEVDLDSGRREEFGNSQDSLCYCFVARRRDDIQVDEFVAPLNPVFGVVSGYAEEMRRFFL